MKRVERGRQLLDNSPRVIKMDASIMAQSQAVTFDMLWPSRVGMLTGSTLIF